MHSVHECTFTGHMVVWDSTLRGVVHGYYESPQRRTDGGLLSCFNWSCCRSLLALSSDGASVKGSRLKKAPSARGGRTVLTLAKVSLLVFGKLC